jgi:hypothetical protein
MADEAYVQIEIPRTGQKIRNLSTTALQPDGTVATVLMQVVALADANGQVLNQPATAWDPQPDTAWDSYLPGARNFATINRITINSAWET